MHVKQEADKIRAEEQKKEQNRLQKIEKLNKEKKGTKVPEKKGFKKRPKQKA